uniref:C2H2-type domain-containing protein n=1 Tax=Timema shepardi TaxID=629360 RepID=A0A7R9AN88_TIMSH|nr:unnamed protein product [Timema shepardi]
MDQNKQYEDTELNLWLSVNNSSEDKESCNYRCEHCGKSYLRKRTLSRHRRYDCGTEPRFTCSLCGVRVRRRYALTGHLMGIHGIDHPLQRINHHFKMPHESVDTQLKGILWGPPFSCHRCGRLYSHKCNLMRHLRLECGVRPRFACGSCAKKFKHRHHLQDHQKTHMNQTI